MAEKKQTKKGNAPKGFTDEERARAEGAGRRGRRKNRRAREASGEMKALHNIEQQR